MALTAREWLLLPEKEQKERADELSPHECFLLRTDLAYCHFSEEEKRTMSKERREKFLKPSTLTEEEKKLKSLQIHATFQRMIKEAEEKKKKSEE